MGDLITVKVFIHWNEIGAPEVRRFVTEKCIVSNFHDLTAKLEDGNPRLRGNTYSVFWTDEEGDDVTISSTDDMLVALGVMQSLVKLSVYCKEEKPEILKIESAKTVVYDGGKKAEPSSAQSTPSAVKNTATASSQPASTRKIRPRHLIPPKSNILVINQPLTNDFRQFLKSLVTAKPEAKSETPQQSTENNTNYTQADTSSSKYNQKPQLEYKRIDSDEIQRLINNSFAKLSSLQLITSSGVKETKDKGLRDFIMPDGIKVNVNSETSSPVEAEQEVSKYKLEGWTFVNNHKEPEPSIAKRTASGTQNAATAPPQPESTSKTNPAPDMAEQAKPKPRQPHPKVHIESALQNMIAMGFNNDGGWLTKLLESKDGNIAAVLNLLTPVNTQK